MQRTLVFALVGTLVAGPMAGCTASDEAGPTTFGISGTFTENATQEEMEELELAVQDRGGEMVVLESFPAQYQISGLSKAQCETVRDILLEAGYVESVGTCTEDPGDTGDGDRSVRNRSA